MKHYLFALLGLASFTACSKDAGTNNSSAKLIIRFQFDSAQARLNNIGQPSVVPPGRGTQSPMMNKMSAHYIELSPGALTPLGSGAIVYKAPETSIGGATAIDWEKSKTVANGETFLEIPISQITPAKYSWLRISLAYQNANVKMRIDTTINGIAINNSFPATLAGFIGFNTYIKNFLINTQSLPVNANKAQGFWGFETTVSAQGFSIPVTQSGQAPAGATTVVNPLFQTSPIPPGSCVVTGAILPGEITITGRETADIIIDAAFSINKSFEWIDANGNGLWEPLKGETVVDMGIRGMVPTRR
jgi:hypothetical protein